MAKSGKRRLGAGMGVRTFTNKPLGLWPVRIISCICILLAVGLAVLAIKWWAVHPLPFAAILLCFGLFLFFWGHVDVWRIDKNQGTVTCIQRRILDESAGDSFPISSVEAVRLTAPDTDSDGNNRYQVDLILHSGRIVFISNRRRHAAELSALLGVPTRTGLFF